MVHHAKVDSWVAVLLGGGALFIVLMGATVFVVGLFTDDPAPGIALIVAAGGLLPGLMLWGCYKTRYEVAPPDLIVRFGPLRSRVPLAAIVAVYPTNNPISAPAPSLDRMRIDYRRKNGKMWFALISPKDKEVFVRDLASAAPQLRSEGSEPLRLKAEEPA